MFKEISNGTVNDKGTVNLQGPSTPYFRLRRGEANCGGFPVIVTLNGVTATRYIIESDASQTAPMSVDSVQLVETRYGAFGDAWALDACAPDALPQAGEHLDLMGATLVRSAGHREVFVLDSTKQNSAWLVPAGSYAGTPTDYVISPAASDTFTRVGAPPSPKPWDVRELKTLALVVEHFVPGGTNNAVAMSFYLDFYAAEDGSVIESVPLGSTNNFGAIKPDGTANTWAGEKGYLYAGAGQPEAQTAFSQRTGLWFPFVAVRMRLEGGLGGTASIDPDRYNAQSIVTRIRLLGW